MINGWVLLSCQNLFPPLSFLIIPCCLVYWLMLADFLKNLQAPLLWMNIRLWIEIVYAIKLLPYMKLSGRRVLSIVHLLQVLRIMASEYD